MAHRFVKNILGDRGETFTISGTLKETNTFDGKPILNRKK